MFDPILRENNIMEILDKLLKNKLDFIVVGGYGVSAFRHRFSVDADIVIKKEDLQEFENSLKNEDYKKTIYKKLENTYSSEFIRYENSLKVSVDLLIGGMQSMQTGASFSFDFVFENSEKRNIEGIAKSVKAYVPKKEVLIILKLHSGRLTDLRDIAALSFNLDLDFIKSCLFRGDVKIIKENMKKLETLIEEKNFQDSFKGVFMEKKYKLDKEEIKKLVNLK